VKNITIALDDETYRQARIAAARCDSSVSALVKKFLLNFNSQTSAHRDLKQEQETLLDSIWQRHPEFTMTENISRDFLHRRS
jgi:hypothetical protein